MADQDTRALVRDLYTAYAGGDRARVADIIDDDVDYGPVQVFDFVGAAWQGRRARSARRACRRLRGRAL